MTPAGTIALCLTVALLGITTLSAQSQTITRKELPFDEGIIRSDLTGAGGMDMSAGFVGDTLYLPFGLFTSQLGVKQSISNDNDTLNVEFPINNPIRFIRSANTYTGDSTVQLPAGSIREYDGEVYIREDILLGYLGIRAIFDARRLRLVVQKDGRIPAIQRAANRDRYALLSAQERDERSRQNSTPRGVLFGSAMVRWSTSGVFAGDAYQSGSGFVNIAGPLLYGTADVQGFAVHSGVTRKSRLGISQGRWMLPLVDFSPLRRITLGVIPNNDASPTLSLGLSNLRLAAPRNLAMRDLSGTTMPGWDVELYEGTRMVEVTQADSLGYYSFALPVGYGEVMRTVHEVGPHGERIVTDRRIGLPMGSTLPGEIEYDALLTRTTEGEISQYGGALTMSAGVFDWLNIGATARGRAAHFDAGVLDSIEVEPLVNMWMGRFAALELRGSPQKRSLGGTLDLAFTPTTRMNIAVASSFVTKETSIRGGFDLPLGQMSLNVLGNYGSSPSGDVYEVTPRISVGVQRLYLMATTSFSLDEVSRNLKQADAVAPGVRIVSSGRLTYRPMNWMSLAAGSSYDFNTAAPGTSHLSLTTSFGGVSFGVQYSVPGTSWSKGTIQAQMSFDMGIASSRTTSQYYNDKLTATSTLDGTFSVSSAGVTSETNGSTGSGNVVVQPFVDRNLNGKRDAGEEVEGQIRARMVSGDGMVAKSSGGRFANVRPYVEWFVEIDHSSLGDQGLTPIRSEFTVFSIPSVTHVIEVPFAEGNDVDGYCEIELPGGRRKTSAGVLNGLRVRMTSTNGVAAYQGEVFFDGSILVTGVAPGTYNLEFDRQQLEDRLIALKDVSAPITIGEKGTTLPLIVFVPAADKRVN